MLNLTEPSIAAAVEAASVAVEAGADDLLFVAGSVVDGLANDNSDLDLYFLGRDGDAVIGAETTVRKGEKSGTIGVIGGREVSVSIIEPAGLSRLRADFGDCLGALGQGDGIVQLESQNDLKLLHRVRTGVPVRGETRLHSLRQELGTDRLAEYLVNVHGVAAVNRLVDVEGELAEGGEDSASWMLREASSHLARFALALEGQTNPAPKWLVKLLGRARLAPADRALLLRGLLEPGRETKTLLDTVKIRLREMVLTAPDELVGPYLRRQAERKLP
ncbi:hypothetical protein Ssi03_13840 [Sphaerisporangium siamense]|uniref:Nucleotidyltransferase domain-containing protein n=1 Tax=Sphaerisporangium siamense TaxID=795645 RepID=A0A7W7GBV1_9ACTN|nr:hypothetical protein [Sphaerisporangium siamense]MBB4702849.1 hypothetical protein [Sphaerisporangium siamense]GII83394.1 hypothetical protein Ssi03_13840 [Sphaerisporangium siamense]